MKIPVGRQRFFMGRMIDLVGSGLWFFAGKMINLLREGVYRNSVQGEL